MKQIPETRLLCQNVWRVMERRGEERREKEIGRKMKECNHLDEQTKFFFENIPEGFT